MQVFRLKLNLRNGVSVVDEGFDGGVLREGTSRLLFQARFERGNIVYYLAGRSYSFTHREELQLWLDRFSPKAIKEWAAEIDGDFMAVVFDRMSHVAYLLSDRNGANRIYYARQGEFVSFSNSLFDIMNLVKSPRISPFAAYSLLISYYVLDPFTLVEPVKCTMPGQVVIFEKDCVEVSSYYSPVRLDVEYFRTESESVQALGDSFQRVFQKHVTEERTPCVLLSGGIDSVAMLKYLSEAAPERVHSLTFSVRGQKKDEHKPARLAADHFLSKHHELIIEPNEAASLYLQCFRERLVPNISTLLALAARNYLHATGINYDVFTGEDTRLHTPYFDTAKEIGIDLNLRRDPSAFSVEIRSLIVRLLDSWPFYPKGYLKHWSQAIKPYKSRGRFMLDVLAKVSVPVDYNLESSTFYGPFLRELPQIALGESVQDIFKKSVAMGYRLQYTDNMAETMMAMNTLKTALHIPFYDWETVEVSNQIPYHIGSKGVWTLRSWSKFPIVNKRVLRRLLKESVPRSILYRTKTTADSFDVLLDSPLQRMVHLILDRWGSDLIYALGSDVGTLAKYYMKEFCQAPSVRIAGQKVTYSVLSICQMAILNQVCKGSGFDLNEEINQLYEMAMEAEH